MALDAIFNGPPTDLTPNSGSGVASLGLDVSAGQLYYRTPRSGWQETAGGSAGPEIRAARLVYTVSPDDISINNNYLGSDNSPTGLTVTWSTPFTDTNYTVTWGIEFDALPLNQFGTETGYNYPGQVYIKTPAGITVYVISPASAVQGDVIVLHAIAVHD